MAGPRSYRYRVVDVFTTQPLEGNPLGVFPDSSGLDDVTMQKIAKELNLAETTFVSPAVQHGCCARVRIFTPAREMPFAGHPTIGTSLSYSTKASCPKVSSPLRWKKALGPSLSASKPVSAP